MKEVFIHNNRDIIDRIYFDLISLTKMQKAEYIMKRYWVSNYQLGLFLKSSNPGKITHLIRTKNLPIGYLPLERKGYGGAMEYTINKENSQIGLGLC